MSRELQGRYVTSWPMPDSCRLVFTSRVDGIARWLGARGYDRAAILLWKVTGLW